MNWTAIEREAEELLVDLVRADTSNPPGNEVEAAGILSRYFEHCGVPHQVIESEPGRANVLAEVGEGSRPPLYLVSHLDVVGPGDGQWERDPFGGEIADGEIWGRGTVDTKQVTAMDAVTLALLVRRGAILRRRLVFLATADEERGSRLGMQHLVESLPGLFQPGLALNEGGGFSVQINGRRFYLLDSAQKGSAQFSLRAEGGQAGHPGHRRERTPIRDITEALGRIYDLEAPAVLGETSREFFSLAADALDLELPPPGSPPGEVDRVVSEIICSVDDPVLRGCLSDAVRTTYSPNVISGGGDVRRPPVSARAGGTCRILPDVSCGSLHSQMEAMLAGVDVQCSIDSFSPGYDAGTDNELVATCREVIEELDPGARVLPFFAVGRTDSRLLWPKEIRPYGFAPVRGLSLGEAVARAHGVDERLPRESLGFGVRATYMVAEKMCT
ncbi:MAG: M20/M25/M40 family metallo-hydrolase [Bacillota bacterium]